MRGHQRDRYHFRHTPANMARWQTWWRNSQRRALLQLLMTCFICLILLALISYSLFYDEQGNCGRKVRTWSGGLGFVWAQGDILKQHSFAGS